MHKIFSKCIENVNGVGQKQFQSNIEYLTIMKTGNYKKIKVIINSPLISHGKYLFDNNVLTILFFR